MPYIPHSQAELEEMLATIGVKTLDDLFADISPDMRPKSFNLPEGMDEGAACAFFEDLAARNRTAMVSFLGAGYYDHSVPKAVDALALSARAYTRILRVARTIADLEGEKDISLPHIAEAVGCRALDRGQA